MNILEKLLGMNFTKIYVYLGFYQTLKLYKKKYNIISEEKTEKYVKIRKIKT